MVIVVDTFDIDVDEGREYWENVHEKHIERMYISNGKRSTYWDENGREISL